MTKNTNQKDNRNKLLFITILFLACLIRFWKLSDLPPALNWDEVSHGYNAYSILITGKDEWGFRFPQLFRAYGDYKLPVYIYATTLSIILFGLNAFSVRFISALAGVMAVLSSYYLVKKLINSKVALIAALLIAVEPWSLFLSRAAFEANLAFSLFTSATYFFISGLKKPKKLIISAVLFGLSVWTYNSYRIFIPLFVTVLIILYRRQLSVFWKINKKPIVIFLLSIAFFFLPMLIQLSSSLGQARYDKVSLIDSGAVGKIITARNNSSLNKLFTRLIFNRPTYFTHHFIKNYLSHFSAKFLFFEGGSHYQFSIPQMGLLYLINMPFFYLGLFLTLKQSIKQKYAKLLLFWMMLAPVASSITRESPHVLRSITFLPAPMIFSAIGTIWLTNRVGKIIKHAALILYIIIVFFSLSGYLGQYFDSYKKQYSWSWQYGYKQVVDIVKSNYSKYDKIIITKKYGEPHEYFLFYWPWDPKSYRSDSNLIRFYQSNWYWVDKFDKFYFVNDWDIPSQEWEDFKLESGEIFNCESSRCLLITSPDNNPKSWTRSETIKFLDNTSAFEIYEN